jgi:hypothetical protein
MVHDIPKTGAFINPVLGQGARAGIVAGQRCCALSDRGHRVHGIAVGRVVPGMCQRFRIGTAVRKVGTKGKAEQKRKCADLKQQPWFQAHRLR